MAKVELKKFQNGKQIEVYKSSIRNTYVNAKDCTTEYNEKGEILFDKNNRPPKN